jgi:hypothetical protein
MYLRLKSDHPPNFNASIVDNKTFNIVRRSQVTLYGKYAMHDIVGTKCRRSCVKFTNLKKKLDPITNVHSRERRLAHIVGFIIYRLCLQWHACLPSNSINVRFLHMWHQLCVSQNVQKIGRFSDLLDDLSLIRGSALSFCHIVCVTRRGRVIGLKTD